MANATQFHDFYVEVNISPMGWVSLGVAVLVAVVAGFALWMARRPK